MEKNHSYTNLKSAEDFRKYSESEDAKIEQGFLYDAIKNFLPKEKTVKVLDAACGTGWLSKKLYKEGYSVSACDVSEVLVADLVENYQEIRVDVCDLNTSIPYEKENFDCVLVNMSCHDFENLEKALSLLHEVTVFGGKMIVTIANPYYSYPVGRWKRGFWGKLFGKMPSLILFPYNFLKRSKRTHTWKGKVPSYFYTLPEYFEAADKAGFKLRHFEEIGSQDDSKVFNRKYQMYRFPMILMLVFEK